MKVVPFLTYDSTSISPFIFSTISFDIVRPSPIPFLFILLGSDSFPKNLKSFAQSSSLIPIPVSFTLVTKQSRVLQTSISILPLKVNLIAFPIRLNKIYLYLPESAYTSSGSSQSILTFNQRFFSLTGNSRISTTSLMAFLILKFYL